MHSLKREKDNYYITRLLITVENIIKYMVGSLGSFTQ